MNAVADRHPQESDRSLDEHDDDEGDVGMIREGAHHPRPSSHGPQIGARARMARVTTMPRIKRNMAQWAPRFTAQAVIAMLMAMPSADPMAP